MKHDAELPKQRPTSPGFARVAKQISSWTTRAVLTVMILVAGVAVGREVLDWWRADSAPAPGPVQTVAVGEGLEDPTGPQLMQFGDQQWSFTRQTLRGSAKDVTAALRAACRKATGPAAMPPGVPGPAEKEFLRSVAGKKPVEEAPGQWRVYELEDAFPMVAGVRVGPAGQPPEPLLRVVAWAMAFPQGSGEWAAYQFSGAAGHGGKTAVLPGIDLPPESQQTLAIRFSEGGGVLSFRGPSRVETWKQFFDSWLAQNGWKAAGGWRQYGSRWHLRCEKGPAGAGQAIEVHFGPDDRGGQVGVVIVAPVAVTEQRE